MDAALGPPAKMAENESELTPMMSQYFELCRQYDDSLVLFQVGDFYETFCEAAEITARLLEITLTKREDSTGEYPMAGIPIDNAESYIETLLDAGYRVAVADQVQDPEETTGVVDRAVTRIVTPGTLTEDELLATDDNNFVACLTADDDGYGIALLDISTGDFYATGADELAAIADEIGRFDPAEAIVGPELGPDIDVFSADCMVTPYEASVFDHETARETVAAYFGAPEELLAGDAEIRACGALLDYAEYTRGGEDGQLGYLNHLTRYDPREFMLLDAVALRSLELFESRAVHGDDRRTLVGILDETACALGSRRLKDWLRRPLIDRDRIESRQTAVAELTGSPTVRDTLQNHLRDVYDIERLISRVSRGRANARDLRSLKTTLDVIPAIKAELEDVEAEKLVELRVNLDELADVRSLIGRAIQEEPPAEITEGDVIKAGYSDELDELRSTEREGKAWIDDLEAKERDRTGIDSLKVGYNSVHGYYIEVTDPNLDRVPEEYTRRQTLKNAERFYTPALKQREDEIIRAEQRADDLEHRLFREVRATVAEETERIQTLADAIATLDVLCAFATAAAEYDYSRPTMVDQPRTIEIRGGRHPVVERTEESFVPNDTKLDDEDFVAIITGPNMSGKSTYMRQVALIAVMAQAGSFVPAADARLGILDRVFTRVGASDDIAGGRSTFMVEMTELAEIIESASDRSLILLDEVGRGTSTADGLAIAQAVTEFIHDEIGAITLFATHHHDLTTITGELPGVLNLHFGATRESDTVAFDHNIARGAATASYGIEVAQMAGVPDSIVQRSRYLLDEDTTVGHGRSTTAEDERETGVTEPTDRQSTAETRTERTERDHDDPATETVNQRLADLDLANTTPLDALTILHELKQTIDEA